MNIFEKLWTLYGPRVVAALAAGATTKLAEKGITVDPGTLISIGFGTYGIIHKAISSRVNPGDAASGRMAEAEKRAVDTSSTVVVRPKL